MTVLDQEARALVAAARGEPGLSPEGFQAGRGRLVAHLATSAAAATTTLTASAAAGTGVSWTAQVGLGIALVVAGVVVAGALLAPPRPPAADLGTAPSAAAAAPGAGTPGRELTAPRPAGSGGEAELRSAASAEAPLRALAPASAQRGLGAPAPSADSGFAADARLLRQVRESLAAGRPEEALAQLERRRSDPTRGVLGPEREAARLMTLCQLGRFDEARPAVARFLSANPHSPLAERVAHACKPPAPSARPAAPAPSARSASK